MYLVDVIKKEIPEAASSEMLFFQGPCQAPNAACTNYEGIFEEKAIHSSNPFGLRLFHRIKTKLLQDIRSCSPCHPAIIYTNRLARPKLKVTESDWRQKQLKYFPCLQREFPDEKPIEIQNVKKQNRKKEKKSLDSSLVSASCNFAASFPEPSPHQRATRENGHTT